MADIGVTATFGIVSRPMLGKVKHANLVFLWIQEPVERLIAPIRNQLTSEMLPDMLTKFVVNREIMRSLGGMGFLFSL